MKKYVIATIKDWHLKKFDELKDSHFKECYLISDPKKLTLEFLRSLRPRYIFFPHWSWIVPEEIVNSFECVCFHSSDVPYGRGGSPIQNLIIRGHTKTKVTALRMVKELDAGPVYAKEDLSLEGKAQDIFERSADVIARIIKEIIDKEPIPVAQEGEVVVFKRRKGEDNILPNEGSASDLYDHIRMLDANSYPHSYLEHGNFIIEFFDAVLEGNEILAKVRIVKK